MKQISGSDMKEINGLNTLKSQVAFQEGLCSVAISVWIHLSSLGIFFLDRGVP